jgi:hypothetical protein
MMKPLQDGFVSGILRNAFFLKNAWVVVQGRDTVSDYSFTKKLQF